MCVKDSGYFSKFLMMVPAFFWGGVDEQARSVVSSEKSSVGVWEGSGGGGEEEEKELDELPDMRTLVKSRGC